MALNTMIKLNKINVILLSVALIASSFGFSANAASVPTLGDQSANVTGSHNVVLSIFVNPNGNNTTLHFQYWTGSNFKERLYLGVTGTSSVRIQVGLINLFEGSNYSYQVVAENAYGTTTGNTGTFTTPGSNQSSTGSTTTSSSNNTSTNNTSNGSGSNTSISQSAPTVTTYGPSSISTNPTVINGIVNPNGTATSFWFEFGTTQSLGQTTTAQNIGSGNSPVSVTGNLTGLQNATYYYRVVARNSYGTIYGLIWYFNTGTGQAAMVTGQGSGTASNGQVLGAVSGSGTGTGTGAGTGTGTGSSSTSSDATKTSTATKPKTTTTNPRPSFISLEYSLDANGALVLVANNLKPKPGEEFSYTIITKNDSQSSFNETSLKVLLPAEVDYVSANTEPLRISGEVIEFDLGTVAPMSQTETVVTVRVKETAKPGTSMIFTSVLGYKDRSGTQLATTSYMTVKVGQGGGGISLSALSFGSISGSSVMLVLVALGLLMLMALLTYKFVRIRNGKNGNSNGNGKKSEENDIFGKGAIPPTFEPVTSNVTYKN